MKQLFSAEYRKFQAALAIVVPLVVKAVADGNVSPEEIGLIVLALAGAFGVKAVTNKG